jgi:hypothetical protein
MERLPTIAGAAVMLGIVEQSVIWHWREPDYVDPILFLVVLVALLVTHVRTDRTPELSAWQAVREVRPIPRELARLAEVRVMRWGAAAVGIGVLLAVPLFLSESRTLVLHRQRHRLPAHARTHGLPGGCLPAEHVGGAVPAQPTLGAAPGGGHTPGGRQ